MRDILGDIFSLKIAADVVTGLLFALVAVNILLPAMLLESISQYYMIGDRYHHTHRLKPLKRSHRNNIVLGVAFILTEIIALLYFY